MQSQRTRLGKGGRLGGLWTTPPFLRGTKGDCPQRENLSSGLWISLLREVPLVLSTTLGVASLGHNRLVSWLIQGSPNDETASVDNVVLC